VAVGGVETATARRDVTKDLHFVLLFFFAAICLLFFVFLYVCAYVSMHIMEQFYTFLCFYACEYKFYACFHNCILQKYCHVGWVAEILNTKFCWKCQWQFQCIAMQAQECILIFMHFHDGVARGGGGGARSGWLVRVTAGPFWTRSAVGHAEPVRVWLLHRRHVPVQHHVGKCS
jgi:hypothetical protein